MLETALDAAVVMRADGRIAGWNAQAERVFGWSRAEDAGRAMSDIIVPHRHREAHERGLKRYLATGDGPVLRTRIEITALRRSGEEFPIELSISPLRRGDDVLFVGFVRDITRRLDAARRLDRQAREADLLFRVTSLAAESSSLDEVVRVVLDGVLELLGWPAGHAFLPGPTGVLLSAAWAGDAHAFPSLRGEPGAPLDRAGPDLPSRVHRSREPLWIGDAEGCDLIAYGAAGVGCAFAFPILARDEVLAVLEFFGPAPAPPDAGLMRAARIMSEQVGRVIERERVRAHQAMLLAELDHRAKNMLAVVMGMASQTAKSAVSVERFTQDFSARLGSLSRAYGLLTAKNWRSTTLEALVGEVVAPHLAATGDQFSMTGGELTLAPKTALSISMILHELVTNAVKYGALKQPEGRIAFSSIVEERDRGRFVKMIWREQGVRLTDPPARRGFGAKLIEASARHELRGRVGVAFGHEGVCYDFDFPLPV